MFFSTIWYFLPLLKNSEIVEYNFTVTEEVIAPDFSNQRVFLINKQFPGPEIRANPFDTVVVNILNSIPYEFTMHFHGLDQKGSNNADGVPYVTQYPIKPNETYTHRINVGDQSGTYWYHSHSTFKGVSVFGPLIIQDKNWDDVVKYNPEYSYDEELTVIVSDIFHLNDEKMVEMIDGPVFQPIDNIKSVLTNGQTYSNKIESVLEEGSKVTTNHASGHKVFNVKKGKTYRVRFIGATNLGFLNCQLANHDMKIIEADGVLSEPITTNRIMLNSGQRYSAIIKFDKEPDNYWGRCYVEERDDPGNGNFIFHYENSKDTEALVKAEAPVTQKASSDNDDWIFRNLTVSRFYYKEIDRKKKLEKYSKHDFNTNYVYPFPKKVDRQIVIDLRPKAFDKSVKYVIQGTVFGELDALLPVVNARALDSEIFSVNGTTFATPKTPLIEKMPSAESFEFPGVYKIKEGESIELIIQNYAFDDGSCFEHPWHFHGHPFYIIDYGEGQYNPQYSKKSYPNPTFRDTDTVFKLPKKNFQPREACGWKVLRFRANNPGVWIMHCHITYHMMMGMQLVFMESPNNKTVPNN